MPLPVVDVRVGEELPGDEVELRALGRARAREGPVGRDALQRAREGGVADRRRRGIGRARCRHRVRRREVGGVRRAEPGDKAPWGTRFGSVTGTVARGSIGRYSVVWVPPCGAYP